MKTRTVIISLSAVLAGLALFAQQQRNESPLDWFNRMDRDKDGKLSKEEVASPRFKEFDADSDGFVTREEYEARVTGQTAGQPAATGSGPGQTANPSPMEWFNTTDRNKDGKLSREEAPSPRFKEIDGDGDGFVTMAEYTAYLNRAALKQLDRDGDGKISQREFHELYQDADSFFEQRRKLAQPADGRKLTGPFPAKDDPLGLRFTQDYFPGTKDPQGRIIAATEANHLAAHRGHLFASFGAAFRNPPTPDPGFEGFAILRKEMANGPWLVDYDFGPKPFRVEALTAVNFTTDANGNKLPQPMARLVAARWSPNKTILVRNDAAGKWEESPVIAGAPLPPGGVFTSRSFGSHVDKATKVHHLFAGTWQGHGGDVGVYRSAVYRAAYDASAPCGLRWAREPELEDVGRIMAFAECNGDLYAACSILNDSPLSGGIFRRVDGAQPRWEQVYRWKEYSLTVWDDEQRMIRGLSAVPDPNGTGREVLIGFRFFPEPIIVRIDPQQGHKPAVELNLREFFGKAFHGGGKYIGTIRCAYNPFISLADPRTGQTVHLAGVQVYHPGFPNPPHNGSHYLIRHGDGSYDWAPIYDPGHPVPVGRSLDATRRILVSPFPEDKGRVLYFAGYDGPYAGNRSAWIYKATLPGAAKATESKP